LSQRFISLGLAVILLFAAVLGRTGYIIFSNHYTVSDSYNSYSLTVDVNEPQLYYSDRSRINNNIPILRAVIRPTTSDLAEVSKIYDRDTANSIIRELKEGYPVVHEIPSKDTQLRVLTAYNTDTNLRQLISTESSGVLSHCGLNNQKLSVNYHIDAKGRILTGDNGTVRDAEYLSREGYILTIDKTLQQHAFDAAKSLKSGAVIIMDAKTARILACVNKPDETYLNKAFSQFSVGSVFKLVTTACALENHLDYSYICNGAVTVGDTVYNCQKNHKHGFVNLKSALAYSCNCYFINLALELGADKLRSTAVDLGFGKNIDLFNGWNMETSSIPSADDLTSKGELALFGFGQGKLTASPLQICSLLCTISHDGRYSQPSLVRAKKEKNGSITEYNPPDEKHILSKETSKTLLEYMRYVVSDGTALNADTNSHKSAGKTATAQTGQFHSGREIYHTWFAGVYPYDAPQYCIVVMCEDGTSGAADCCPVFRTIVENLEE
jgi:cell division protein FtsI/penicillin-binding protein 2